MNEQIVALWSSIPVIVSPAAQRDEGFLIAFQLSETLSLAKELYAAPLVL